MIKKTHTVLLPKTCKLTLTCDMCGVSVLTDRNDVQSSFTKSVSCIVHQDCCASWTTPASATLVRKAPTVTPTPSAETTSVHAHQDTSALPVIKTLTSARWVKLALPAPQTLCSCCLVSATKV